MPFHIVKISGGYAVEDDDGKRYSKKPLPLRRAQAQMRALYVNIPEARTKKEDNSDYINRAYSAYHDTVNMSASELEAWAKTEFSKRASLDRSPIRRNLRLLRKPKDKWTSADARDAMRTVSFVSRMRGAEQGKDVSKDVPYSKRDISLMNWAYSPSGVRLKHLPGKHNQADHGHRGALSNAGLSSSSGSAPVWTGRAHVEIPRRKRRRPRVQDQEEPMPPLRSPRSSKNTERRVNDARISHTLGETITADTDPSQLILIVNGSEADIVKRDGLFSTTLAPEANKSEKYPIEATTPQGLVDRIRTLVFRVAVPAETIMKEAKSETVKIIDGKARPRGDFLVVEDPNSPSTWHLPVRVNGKVDRRLMGAAWASLTEGFRGNEYKGPMKQEAMKKLRALYAELNAKLPGEASKEFGRHTGVIVGFFLGIELANELSLKMNLPGSVMAEDLHITLAYLGDSVIDKINRKKLESALNDWAKKTKPAQAKFSGIGRFATVEDDGNQAVYASVDSPDLGELRQSLVKAIESAGVQVRQDKGFTPHVTIAYLPAREPTPASIVIPGSSFVIDRVELAWGDEKKSFAFKKRAAADGEMNPLEIDGYRPSSGMMVCANCKAMERGICRKHGIAPELDFICDDFAAKGGEASIEELDRIIQNINSEAAARQTPFTVFKDASGDYRWITFSSTAFRDRDGEIVSMKALQSDCDRADTDGNYGPLRWWHVPGVDIGDCDFNMMHNRILIESGTFRYKAVAEQVAKEAPNLEVSIGFTHPKSEPDGDKVYHNIKRFERSLVPKGRVSNLFTTLVVMKELNEMATMQEKIKAFSALLKDDALVNTVLGAAETLDGVAVKSNVQWKEADEDAELESTKAKKPAAKEEDMAEEDMESPEGDEEEMEMSPEEELDMEEEEEEEGKELMSLEDDGPFVGDLAPQDFADMMADVMTVAMTPVIKAMKELRKEQVVTKESSEAAISTMIKEAIAPLAAEISELRSSLSEQKGASAVKEQTEESAETKELRSLIGQMSERLKELEGDQPRVFKQGYVASEDPETITTDERLKSGPQKDPLNDFISGFVLGN